MTLQCDANFCFSPDSHRKN